MGTSFRFASRHTDDEQTAGFVEGTKPTLQASFSAEPPFAGAPDNTPMIFTALLSKKGQPSAIADPLYTPSPFEWRPSSHLLRTAEALRSTRDARALQVLCEPRQGGARDPARK